MTEMAVQNMFDIAFARPWQGSIPELQAVFADPDQPRSVLLAALAWSATATYRPTLVLPQAEWIAMFRRVGFFDIQDPTRVAPKGVGRLFRGATPEYQRGLSWTEDAQVARKYGDTVWVADVPAEAVLAVFPHDMAHTEVVVDLPADVEVREADAAELEMAGLRLAWRGKTPEAVEKHVRRFIRDIGLATIRPSALAWRVEPDLRVRFYGAGPVLGEISDRYRGWLAR
jgi:hypothetical protein